MEALSKEQRINELRKYYGLEKNKAFANFFGITEPNASYWSKNGYLDFEAIYNKCPDISPDWLLSGKGDMLRRPAQNIEGNNNTQVGGNFVQANETINKALDALAREQDISKEAQAQARDVITILKSTINNK